jgi:hypothetical protein
LIDCSQERAFVCLRRFAKAADFSHELERSRSNLFASNRRIEVKECFNIPARADLIGRHYIDRDGEPTPS